MKKNRFLGTPYGNEIAETLKQGQEQGGDLNIEYIPLNRIDVDIDNPRRTGFNVENINNANELIVNNPNLKRIWESLQSLSISIESVGVQQPIKVYRYRDRFRIAFGERRFLASILAQKTTIPAWILYEKPKQLRTIQYIENMQREDLTTWERIQNVQAMLLESSLQDNEQVTVTTLANLSGMSRSRASHYLVILNGTEDVKALIKDGLINNLEKGAYLSRIIEEDKRRLAIQMMLDGQDIKKIEEILNKKNKIDLSSKRGRPSTFINLGKTTNIQIIRKIVTTIAFTSDKLQDYNSVDWSDVKSVSRYWKAFVKSLEEMELENDSL